MNSRMSGVSPQVLSALIRAANPQFRNSHDRVAFAVHSYVVADGYKLTGVGDAAEDLTGSHHQEASTAGWNSGQEYAFRYAPAQASGSQQNMLVKGLPMGTTLVVQSLKADKDGKGGEEPKALDLDTRKYTTDAQGITEGYTNLEGLIKELDRHFQGSAAQSAAASGRDSAHARQPQPETTHSRPATHDPYHDPLREGPMCMGGPTLGASDVVPPGLRAPGQPGMGPLPGVPGLGGTGGMHMGPNDPLFGGHPGIRPPGGMAGPGRGGMPPGARWDPIAPPGMRGFNPDDFQRQHHGLDPDIQQPGPGRGTDFDSMFG